MNIDAFKQFDLSGKTALVTGGATGIGYVMTKALVQSGAKVMIAARRENVLKEAAEKITAECGQETVLIYPVDLNDRDSVKELAAHALSTLNGVDIFVGNAGQEALQKIEEITDEDMDKTIRVNLHANIELTRAFLPHMRKQKWGRFIYSSSAASQFGADDVMSIYGAAKSGLNTWAKYVSAEHGWEGVTANSLIIGFFYPTGMAMAHTGAESLTEEQQKEMFEAASSMIALRRIGKPEEFSGLIQLLASDAGGYITGASIPIDGGWTSLLAPCRPH